MIRIESVTLEQAYKDAASALECSASELIIEVIQSPSSGFIGFFKKNAIIVAARKKQDGNNKPEATPTQKDKSFVKPEIKKEFKQEFKQESRKPKKEIKKQTHNVLNDTIMPESFVSMQEDDYDMSDINFTADYEDEEHEQEKALLNTNAYDVAKRVEKEINELFELTCFKIDKINVSAYDNITLLIEFKGEDAALLIGKEGYRYKALSYMIFNWVNTKYQLQLRLEIAEFLKNQEEAIHTYLVPVIENIKEKGSYKTKPLDGILVHIALKKLRDEFPEKYVAVKTNQRGDKYVLVNEYRSSRDNQSRQQ